MRLGQDHAIVLEELMTIINGLLHQLGQMANGGKHILLVPKQMLILISIKIKLRLAEAIIMIQVLMYIQTVLKT